MWRPPHSFGYVVACSLRRRLRRHPTALGCGAVAATAAAAMASSWLAPTSTAAPFPASPALALWGLGRRTGDRHRDFNQTDKENMSYIDRRRSGVPRMVSRWQNPGVRILPELVTPEEEQALIQEIQEVIEMYGISHVDSRTADIYQEQMKYIGPKAPPVNMTRVTGRYESAQQKLAPWGYGDDFDINKVPPQLKNLMERVASHPDYHLGKPRDITLNYRHSTFFRLDPHLDPKNDGENVLIIGLGSSTVLTLVPPDFNPNFPALNQQKVSSRSWHVGDIDTLVPRRGMCHLHGPARDAWKHGIRVGVPSSDVGSDGYVHLHDWFGSPDRIVTRNSERFSVVFAFADPVLIRP